MPIGTQAKLLRVLEDSRVRRLGGKSEILVDVRVVAATNKPLEDTIRKGSFREDLYYRLNVFPIQLPPLRDRPDDIPMLATALISDLNRKHDCRVTDISASVLERLSQHHWPGNVRELRNVLERAVILAGEGTINVPHLPFQFQSSDQKAPVVDNSGNPAVSLPVGVTIDQ